MPVTRNIAVAAWLVIFSCSGRASVAKGDLYQLTASVASSEEDIYFGLSLAVNAESVVISTQNDPSDSSDVSLSVYDFPSGELRRTIRHPDFVVSPGGGMSLALENDQLVAASSNKVLIFQLSTGSLLRTIESHHGATLFGRSLSLKDKHLVVSAKQQNGLGIVFLYNVFTGKMLQSYTHPSDRSNTHFGGSSGLYNQRLAFDGKNIVIPALCIDNDLPCQGGEVFLYTIDDNLLVRSFRNPDEEPYSLFGFNVLVEGDKVAISNKSSARNRAGRVYMYQTSTGELLNTFNGMDPRYPTSFGNAMDINGDLLAIGQPTADSEVKSNAVYLYDTSSLQVTQSITGQFDEFGTVIAFSPTAQFLVVGQPNYYPADAETLPGRVFIYKRSIDKTTATPTSNAPSVAPSAYLTQSSSTPTPSLRSPPSVTGLVPGLGNGSPPPTKTPSHAHCPQLNVFVRGSPCKGSSLSTTKTKSPKKLFPKKSSKMKREKGSGRRKKKSRMNRTSKT